MQVFFQIVTKIFLLTFMGEKKAQCKSGPVQSKPMLLKGQLYFSRGLLGAYRPKWDL